MTPAQESAKRFNITVPPGVPQEAVALPPGETAPDGSDVRATTVTAQARLISAENRRRLRGYQSTIAAYRELRIDPPWPAPPALRIQYFLPADSAGTSSQGNPDAWAMGVPSDFSWPADAYYWIWDI